MNNLSWLIYAADVFGSLNIVLGITATIGIIGGGAALIIGAVCSASGPNIFSWENADEKSAGHAKACGLAIRHGRTVLIVGAICACVATVIPSQGTIYAIAASEVGEDVLNSKTGSKAIRALDAWLDRQIAGEKEQSE